MNKFDLKFKDIMSSIILEASTKIEHDQISSIRKQIKKLEISDTFYIILPTGIKAGPFDKIRQVSTKSKTCKADAEFYNSKNKKVHSVYVSLKDYAFRQFGGREDLFGGKIYKNMKEEANEKLFENSFIKSRYDLIVKIFNKLNAVKETKKDGLIYDFKKLKNKLKGFKIPMFSFEIPEKMLDLFTPCKFGFDTLTSNESSENNVDFLLVGSPLITKLEKNIIDISIENEKSSIEWNPILYGKTKKNILLDRHQMYLCFMFDENRHTFGDFINCRFVIWPKYKVKGWIHENDIRNFLNE